MTTRHTTPHPRSHRKNTDVPTKTPLLVTATICALLLTGCSPTAAPESTPLVTPAPTTPAVAAEPTETPTPTFETDAYGVRYWDINSDRNEIVYDDGARGMTLAEQQLVVEQAFIVAQCMDKQGLHYRFKLPWQTHPDDRGDVNPNTYEVGDPYYVALWGEYGQTGEYDWTQAGCDGLATHQTGQDNAN